MYHRNKFPYEITVGITFQENPGEVFRNYFQEKWINLFSGNLHIFMKWSFIDICVVILFQKKSNFAVTARGLIFYEKHTAVWFLCVAYKCCNTRKKTPSLTFFRLSRNGKIVKIWENRINRIITWRTLWGILLQKFFSGHSPAQSYQQRH